MKEDLIEYICALSDNKPEVLEQIIDNKYRKFMKFFKLVRRYSDDIVKLKYNESTDEDVLDVTITMSGNVKKDLREDIVDELETLGFIVSSSISKRKLMIIISYDEK